jgi:hypothetical protein
MEGSSFYQRHAANRGAVTGRGEVPHLRGATILPRANVLGCVALSNRLKRAVVDEYMLAQTWRLSREAHGRLIQTNPLRRLLAAGVLNVRGTLVFVKRISVWL